jgi:S-formylglutathione hydrolase FrmB
MRWLLIFFCFLVPGAVFANTDTVQVYSTSMQKNIKCVVVTPKKYKRARTRFPVVYLLHGYSGDYSNWIKKVPVIDSLATVYQVIIVCPDAGYSSWYFDSPVDTTFRYETFTATELPAYIDANYKTIAGKKGRAITGLSMGGHGALFLAIRHTDIFGACGSMSGGLDVSHFTRSYDVPKRLGDTIINRHYYHEFSVLTQLEKYNPKDSLAIIIDCGSRDVMLAVNRTAHEKMLKLNISHDYIERPGTHDWKYWGNAVKYQLLFFREWFTRNKY